jgi:hypothetical protein
MIRHLAGGFGRLVHRDSTSKAAGVTRRHGPNGGLAAACDGLLSPGSVMVSAIARANAFLTYLSRL